MADQHVADAGSIPRCGKGFFYQSQLSVQTLGVHTRLCAIACINICACVKDPVSGFWKRKNTQHALKFG